MTSTHYHQVRGTVTGTDPGDSVEVWFEGGGKRSASFTYKAVSESGNRVLVVAAEDYTGASPAQSPGPHYLDFYLDALEANGQPADVYDVDAQGRVAPDALGVLSHYDGVIWYTGDDVVTRTAGRGGGNADRLALDEMLEFRAYMNEGGKVLYTGDWAGQQYTGSVGNQFYDPQGTIPCNPLPRRHRPAPLPAAARVGRRHQRRPAVLVRRLPRGVRRRPRRGRQPPRPDRDRRPVHRARLGHERAGSPTTRTTRRRSSPRAASCRPTSSRSSRAGRRHAGPSRAGRSTRTRASSSSTARSPTCPTSGSPGR